MTADRLRYLIGRSLAEEAGPEELEELAYLCQLPANRELSQQLLKEALDKPGQLMDMPESAARRIEAAILNRGTLDGRINGGIRDNRRGGRLISLFSLKRLAAACLIALIAGGAVYFLVAKRAPEQENIAREAAPASPVVPGSNRATLTFDDGTSFALDSLANGQIGRNAPVKIVKRGEGLLTYEADGKTVTGKPGYSTVATPRGGQYRVELPDGTRVWLNAASSIRFPNSFEGKERNVEITGEVYFEVVISPSAGNRQPFVVNSNGMQVKVLGTHFNVMAYPEEKDIRTTLLEGSVLVSKAERSVLLKPAEQVSVQASGAYVVRKLDNPERTIAWKNGRFELNGGIEGIMRQIARWYDVEVKYEGDLSGRKFGGAISRSESLEAVLKMLQLTENVSFRMQGRTVVVSP